MLCVVCTRPIPNFYEENKLCLSCATRIKLQANLKQDSVTDVHNLESVEKELMQDLNLKQDLDYEAELNYLVEAKRALILNKQKTIQTIKPKEDSAEYHRDQCKEVNQLNMILTFVLYKKHFS